MDKFKKNLSNEKRDKAKENIVKFIQEEFKDVDITSIFTISLLKEIINDLENKSLDQSLKKIFK